MDNIIFIKEISVDKKRMLFVKTYGENFNMIYRSAMGVHWDDKNKSLYFINPIDQNNIINAFKQIVIAVNEEYGKNLIIDKSTKFININDNVITELINCKKLFN